MSTWRIPGPYTITDRTFKVNLDHFSRAGEVLKPLMEKGCRTLNVFAREITNEPLKNAEKKKKPYLVFLQGGPGFQAPAPASGAVPGWVSRAVKDYTVLLVDQRGTGRSSPITAQTIGHLTPQQQAEYLTMFRADSIVADLEAIRKELHETSFSSSKEEGAKKWSLLGQSFGGFIISSYLCAHPDALEEVFYTGGLPITQVPAGAPTNQLADNLYLATWRRVVKRNQTYYKKYPQDVSAVKKLLRYLHEKGPVALPSGGVLTPRRFLQLGLKFGFEGGFDRVHQLVEEAFVLPAFGGQEEVLSQNFLTEMDSTGGFFDTNPIYAILHEAIYCDGPGQVSAWAAHRVVTETLEFKEKFSLEFLQQESDGTDDVDDKDSSSKPVYFYGEMVFPWMFDDYAHLRCMKEASQILADKKDWPRLYDTSIKLQKAKNNNTGIPRGAALVYVDDMFVEEPFSLETASNTLEPVDIKLWITNEYDHGGLRADGSRVLERLMGLANGTVEPR